jgi:hypothetical protein
MIRSLNFICICSIKCHHKNPLSLLVTKNALRWNFVGLVSNIIPDLNFPSPTSKSKFSQFCIFLGSRPFVYVRWWTVQETGEIQKIPCWYIRYNIVFARGCLTGIVNMEGRAWVNTGGVVGSKSPQVQVRKAHSYHGLQYCPISSYEDLAEGGRGNHPPIPHLAKIPASLVLY